MSRNDNLRQRVKILKAVGQIDSYKELAEILGIKNKSLYNWLRAEYELGEQKLRILENTVNDLWIPLE